MSNLRRILIQSRWTHAGLRWLLGFVFIYASVHKIADPAAFAKIVYGYGLFPVQSINLIAITLPFIELLTGLALVFGRWYRSAAFIIVGLLAAFMLAVSINLARGYEFDCGCFSGSTESTIFFLSGSPWAVLIRDLLLFLIGICIIRFQKAGYRDHI